jgi:hypothetical protein
MGCWNETCAISKMVIRAGEAVRFLPIVQNPYHVGEVHGFPVKEGEALPMSLKGRSGCYIGDLWSPLCYPIRGNYNDYGSIEDIPDKTFRDGAEIDQFVAAFKEYCVKLEMGPNEYHDAPIKEFTLPEILEALQEGRCFMNYHSDLPQYKDRLVPIAWMMIKESVWQSLLEVDVKKSGETWQMKGEPDHTTLNGIKEGIKGIANKGMSRQKQDALMKKIEDKTITPEDTKFLLDALSTQISTRYYQIRTWHSSPIDPPQVNEYLLDVAAEMDYIYSMMNILRINFAPTCGSGSQCDNYKLWKLVNKKWDGIIKDVLKERAEEERQWRKQEKEDEAKEAAEEAAKKKVEKA